MLFKPDFYNCLDLLDVNIIFKKKVLIELKSLQKQKPRILRAFALSFYLSA